MTANRAALAVTAALPLTTDVNEATRADLLTVSRPQDAYSSGACESAASPLAHRHGRPPAQRAATCALTPRPESVSTGRDFTRATIRDWGLAGLADVAELVVSELVTNALQHGLPSARTLANEQLVRLRLLAHAPFVMCMVTDPGSEIPVLREQDPAAESGRGLAVVEACCVRWGWHLLDDGGKVVWALLRLLPLPWASPPARSLARLLAP
ncbi:MAG TPA: ATP-binding protein [Streptosporangiaceae bacterium]